MNQREQQVKFKHACKVDLRKIIDHIAPRDKKGKRKIKWWRVVRSIPEIIRLIDVVIK